MGTRSEGAGERERLGESGEGGGEGVEREGGRGEALKVAASIGCSGVLIDGTGSKPLVYRGLPAERKFMGLTTFMRSKFIYLPFMLKTFPSSIKRMKKLMEKVFGSKKNER